MQGCACVTASVSARMRTLSARPPQSLVIEGGDAAGREAAAMAWARALNCPEHGCGRCAVCRQIDERVFRDLIVIDQAFFEAAKKDDKSGPDALREFLPVWGQPPHGRGVRVTIFPEAHELNLFVANLLLKTLEEPRPGNVFVLTAPQRERLLQTLVSRSYTLTLPWPHVSAADRADRADPAAEEWIAALLGFWDSGLGWFERTSAKGAADRGLAQRIVAGLERELLAALSGEAASQNAKRLARLGSAGLRRLDLALAQAQEALSQPTAPPALVLDWLATALVAKGGRPQAGRAPQR
jgi:DNA polymerase-3 subunit delta'